jgi:hypothetical protein
MLKTLSYSIALTLLFTKIGLANDLRFLCDGYTYEDGSVSEPFLFQLSGNKLTSFEQPTIGPMEYLMVKENNAAFFPEENGHAIFTSDVFHDVKILTFKKNKSASLILTSVNMT